MGLVVIKWIRLLDNRCCYSKSCLFLLTKVGYVYAQKLFLIFWLSWEHAVCPILTYVSLHFNRRELLNQHFIFTHLNAFFNLNFKYSNNNFLIKKVRKCVLGDWCWQTYLTLVHFYSIFKYYILENFFKRLLHICQDWVALYF